MIRTLSGNNSVELDRRLRTLIAGFTKEHGELAVERLDGEEIEPSTLRDSVQSLPFLAERKLVIVRNLSRNKTAGERLEQIINSTGDSIDLVFYESAPDKRSSFYKTLKKGTEFEDFSEPDSRELPKWLVNLAKEKGGSLGLSDANYLVERVGANSQLLSSEIEKLITYEPNVNRQTIDLLTEKTPQNKIFDLLDAAFAGNKKRALELYEQQRQARVEPQEILAMLAWQLRLMALAKLGQGKAAADIAKDVSMSAFPVTKAQNIVKKISLARLREIIAEAEKIDRLVKTKPVDLDEALKSYITTL